MNESQYRHMPAPATVAAEELQTWDNAALARIARGEIDVVALARRTLADRGLSETGEWIGFDAARAYLVTRVA